MTGPAGGQAASDHKEHHAFRAATQLRCEDFAITFNQILAAGVSLIGATLKVELDIQAVRGESLP